MLLDPLLDRLVHELDPTGLDIDEVTTDFSLSTGRRLSLKIIPSL
jgi:hypothetical protein